MSPALNGSSALQHFKRGNAVEKRNGIMFNLYPELPHMQNNGATEVGLYKWCGQRMRLCYVANSGLLYPGTW